MRIFKISQTDNLKRDAVFILYVFEMGTIFSGRYIKGLLFLSKMLIYKRVKLVMHGSTLCNIC